MCTRIYKHNQELNEEVKKTSSEPKTGISSVQTFQRRSPRNAYSNETYLMSNSFRQNYKLVDRV